MSRRKWIISGAVVLLLTVGAELVVRPWYSSKGSVEVVNQGNATMDDLAVSYGNTKVALGRLAVNQSTNVWFTAAGKGTLTLEFNQKGNAMKGFQVQDFDPRENLRNGSKLVLVVKNNRVERFMDEDESRTPLQNLLESVREWFMSDLGLPR
jgi:hypothetical protein